MVVDPKLILGKFPGRNSARMEYWKISKLPSVRVHPLLKDFISFWYLMSDEEEVQDSDKTLEDLLSGCVGSELGNVDDFFLAETISSEGNFRR